MSTLSDVDIRANQGRLFVLYPFNSASVTPLGYDLCLGFAAALDSTPHSLPANSGQLVIPSLSSALVVSKESVWLSPRLMGTLHSRGSLSAKGLILNSTTVDPNWAGQLTFLIFNSSGKDVALEMNETFATLVLHNVSTPTSSGPSTNPITVAKRYEAVFGPPSSHNLFEYLNSAESLQAQREFREMVQKARTPSLGKQIAASIKLLSLTGRHFFQNRSLDWAFKITLVLGLVAVVVSFVAWEACRTFLRDRIGLDLGAYDNKVLALQVTTFFVIIVQLKNSGKK